MLDLLRTHARSWLIKTILGLIVASFALFFGYTEFRERSLEGDRWAAKVDDLLIPRRRLAREIEQNLDEGVDEHIRKLLEGHLLNQWVQQDVAYLFAGSLGIHLSDQAVVRRIQAMPVFSSGGSFDLLRYRQIRLAHQQETGEELEMLIRKDLAREWLDRLAEASFSPWEQEWEKLSAKKIPPGLWLSRWIDKFREKTDVEFYRGSS